jgi:hypothetical protein
LLLFVGESYHAQAVELPGVKELTGRCTVYNQMQRTDGPMVIDCPRVENGNFGDRTSVVYGKRVEMSVDDGGGSVS